MTFGARVRQLRQKRNWTLRDLAAEVHVGFTYLSWVENERLNCGDYPSDALLHRRYVTSNEVRCSENIPQQHQLFRVFNFGCDPRLYILHGSLRELCQLEPVLYRAVV